MLSAVTVALAAVETIRLAEVRTRL